MNPSLDSAFELSRDPSPTAESLPDIMASEEIIARMDDHNWAELQRRLAEQPNDPFLRLWTGLVLAQRGRPEEACEQLAEAIERGCSHWRVGWYIARAAKDAGNIKLVDDACAAVLKINPEFWFARELPKHARGYYAQNGQDKFIEEFFAEHPPRSRVFVEVGAFDGVHYSNVRRLAECHGWSGVAIEPVAANFQKLVASYQGFPVRCVHAAVSLTEGETEIHVSTYPHLPGWGSDVASLSGEANARWTGKYGARWTRQRVVTRPLTSILEEAGITAVDLLTIDAEGHDFEVLQSLEFSRFQPQLIIIEYGTKRDAIAEYLARRGYSILADNRQDVFLARTRPELAPEVDRAHGNASSIAEVPQSAGAAGPTPDWRNLVNPHLLAINALPTHQDPVREELPANALLVPARFDLPAKLIYARHRALGVEKVFARELYQEHIRAFSKGTYREGDGLKNGIEDYLNQFHAVLDSVRENGIDASRSRIPIGHGNVLIDGAHRVAAALLHQRTVPILRFDRPAGCYDGAFFEKRGLGEKWRDAMALEFCRRHPQVFILHLFPTAQGREDDARAILRECGEIVCEKNVRLTGAGPWLLTREMYAGEKWIGSWANDFAGARKDASIRFDGEAPLRLFVFCCDSLEKVREAKARIRELYGKGNYSSHINDTHEEAVRLAELYFNANSLHWLNHARPRYLQRFHRHLQICREWLQSAGIDPETVCVDGSAAMAAYGLRDANDLDVLHLTELDFSGVRPAISSHNAEMQHHTLSRDAILFHPDHHFHCGGLKFTSLAALRAMKERRGEGKDFQDIQLIDSLEKDPAPSTRPAPRARGINGASTASREALRLYYVPNGDDYHIAALLDQMYTSVTPFGCRDVRDYIARRTLAYKTPGASEQLWNEVSALRPDLVYVESARNIDPAVLQRIRTELGIPVTMWFGDACVNDAFVERLLDYGNSVDFQVVVDRKAADAARRLGRNNVEFIPYFGYDHYFRPLEVPRTIDILFSGKSYHRSLARYPFARERLDFIQRVNREFGQRLFVVGEDWESFALENCHGTRVPEWEVNRLNNASHIVLAFDAAHVDGFTSCRTYHALLGGSFVLIRRFPGIERLFVNHQHLVWFETAEEGIALLREYLERPDERRRIAEAGRDHVCGNGWIFSNVVRHIVARGLKRETRGFEEIHAPYSRALSGPGSHPTTPAPRVATETVSAPSTSPGGPSDAVHQCLRHADRLFSEGRLAEARDWLERALDLAPDANPIRLAVGNLSLQLGDTEKALSVLGQVAAAQPDDVSAQVAFAAACVRAGRIEEFENALSRAFQMDPANPAATRLLADLNLESERYLDAARGYHQLLLQDPSDIGAMLALGVCFAKAGEPDAARAAFEEVLRHEPANQLARDNLRALGVDPKATPQAETSPAAEGPEILTHPVIDPRANDSVSTPILSAIISCYDADKFLAGCLEDLLAQTIASRLEIIVIDSGSPGNERGIVERFHQRHPGIRYLRTERETIYAAWNRAIQMATGKYLTSANVDDRHRPDALERLVAALESHPGHALAYADCAICENVHPDFGYPEIRGYYRWPDFDPVLLFRGCYMGPQPVWRRELHSRYGLFDATYRVAGDYEFWLRMARTEKFLHIPEVLGLHWYSASSLGHHNRDLTREESERARIRHWPAEWGVRPTQTFRTTQATPAIQKVQQQNAELRSRVETLQKEVSRLEAQLAAQATPKQVAKSAAHPFEGACHRAVAASTMASATRLATVSAQARPAQRTSASAAPAFSHLAQGFELMHEKRFVEAQAACGRYQAEVEYDLLPRTDQRTELAPRLTVIIVAHQTGPALIECLDSLSHPDNPPHEIIVVDNGGNEGVTAELQRRPLLHVTTPFNVLPSEARNIGVHFARAPIACFLDDDATAEPGYLSAILTAFETYHIQGLRGRVLPKSGSPRNERVRHYDLGDTPFPADLNTEGNCAVRVETWRRLGGQDPLLFGGEGLELSYRIARDTAEASLIYWPFAVILHDYADEDSKLNRKKERHAQAREYLEWKHPGILKYHARSRVAPKSAAELNERVALLQPRHPDPDKVIAELRRRVPEVTDIPLPDLLRTRLQRHGWISRFDRYAEQLESVRWLRNVADPEISIVIIAHEVRPDCVRALEALRREQGCRFELVYVLNGSGAADPAKVSPLVDVLVTLRENTGAYFARNVGAVFAAGPILLFLDDDAIPADGCAAAHLREFNEYDVIAVRGAILPKTENPLNELAKHYHLGDTRFPIYSDIEGNTSYLARAFFSAGGWDDDIVFGGGGIDLAFRLLTVDRDRRRQIYSPSPVIFHDYAANEEHLARKRQKQGDSRERLRRKHPNFDGLRASWRSFQGREQLVMRKTPAPRASSAASHSNGHITATSLSISSVPRLTVAIPTYNRGRFLIDALRSALQQTLPPCEILVVDDGSTDDTAARIASLNDTRIRYIQKEHSGGPATRNRCISEASGEFIVWLDSDDVLLPGTLEIYARALARHPDADVLYGDILASDEHLNVQTLLTYRDYHGWQPALLAELATENRIPNVCTLVRKSCYEAVGGYDPEFPRAHDYEFWTRLAPLASIRHVGAEVAIYRRHEDSLSRVHQAVDTRYEANVFKGLLRRHDIADLFPFCYATGAPRETGDSRAWILATLLMLRYGDLAAAAEFAGRVQKPDQNSARLHTLLGAVLGKTRKVNLSGNGEFVTHLSKAIRHYIANEAGPCARECARLAEIQPGQTETLLLVGLSLQRWSHPHEAQTAFKCLLERQCHRSRREALAETESHGPRHPASSEAQGGELAALLSTHMGGLPIPQEAIDNTLAFIAAAAHAVSPEAHLATHRAQLTPLFMALLALTRDELPAGLKGAVADQIARVRAALESSSVPTAQSRPEGYSFCILSSGQRPDKLERLIASIHNLRLENVEILVGGQLTNVPNGVQAIDFGASARAGRTGKIRNQLARRARFRHLVFCSESIVLNEGFASGMARLADTCEAMAVRILNPDGTRYIDWAASGGTAAPLLLHYWQTDPEVLLPDAFCVVRAGVMDRIAWDENLGTGDRPEVDFSSRLRAAGVSIQLNPFCSVLHDDDRFTCMDGQVLAFEQLLEQILTHRQTGQADQARQLLATAERMAVGHPDRLRALRECAHSPATSSTPVAVPTRANGQPASKDAVTVRATSDHATRSNVETGAPSSLRLTYLISSILGVTGGNQSLLRQAEEMRRRGHDVTIVTYTPKPDWIELKSRHLQAAHDQPLASLVPPSDVVVSTYFTNTHELLSVDAPVKIYYAQGDQFVFSDDTLPDTELNRNLKKLSRASYLARGVRLVPNSRNLARAIEQLCGRRPDAILPVCTDQTIFRPLTRTPSTSGPRILIVGPDARGSAMEPLLFKGIQDVRHALELLRKRGVPFTAVRMSSTSPEIFADFPCEFHVTPCDSLKTRLYGTADILVYASHYDSCPRPPQEAMAAGCAVVCTATDGAMEYCRDGVNALLVPVRSPAGIADAIQRLVQDPDLRQRLVSGGFATAAEYPREREWNEWEALLQRWVEESRQTTGDRRVSGRGARTETPAARPAAETLQVELPPCALVGQLGPARELLRQGKHRDAWNTTLAAIRKRPFHPEAQLLMAEISLAAGDISTARQCAERAQQMAPKWKRPGKFLKKLSGRGKAVKRDWLALPADPARPRLSVCLIVRNEEAFLARCLESVKAIADQIIVVDTGSTDRTIEIARAHGAEVHHFEWRDDFSAARNFALEHATGDWILALDADEELPAAEHGRLLEELNRAHVLGLRLPLINAGMEHEGQSFVPRLFRNAPGLFYISRVHEQIFSSILVRAEEWGLETAMGTAQILHHGYSSELVRTRRKTERNLRLLEQAVREVPSDANLLMNLGLELSRCDRFDEGLARYEEAFAALSSNPDQQQVPELREALLTQFTSQLMRARRFDDVVRVLHSPVARLSQLTATLCFTLGLALMKLRRFDHAAESFRQCLARRDQPALSPINPEILRAGPGHCLAQCLIELGQIDAAVDALTVALKADPHSRAVRMDLARLHAHRGRPVEALQLLHGLISEAANHAEPWRLGAEIALASPELLEFALDWTGEAIRHLPNEPVLARQRGEALLLAGDPAGARPFLRTAVPSDSSMRAALCFCDFLAGDVSADWPSANEPAVSAEFLKWYQRMVETPAAALLDEINTRLPELARCLPTAASRLEAAIAEVA